MFSGDLDLDAAERLIDGWQSAIEKRASEAKTLAQRLGGLRATARSKDGLVEVTVGASGVVNALSLDEKTRGQSASETSRQILAVMREAQAELARRTAEVTAETLGPDSTTGQAIVDSFAQRFGGAAQADADARP